VQFGQRVALSGTADKQYGHSFVVGAAAGAGFLREFAALMIMNMAKAMIKKLITAFKNDPMPMLDVPTFKTMALKSVVPKMTATKGIMMSLTSEPTIAPNAPSKAFPRWSKKPATNCHFSPNSKPTSNSRPIGPKLTKCSRHYRPPAIGVANAPDESAGDRAHPFA